MPADENFHAGRNIGGTPAKPLEIVSHLVPASRLESSLSHPAFFSCIFSTLPLLLAPLPPPQFVFMKFRLRLMPIATTLRRQNCFCFEFPRSSSYSSTMNFEQNFGQAQVACRFSWAPRDSYLLWVYACMAYLCHWSCLPKCCVPRMLSMIRYGLRPLCRTNWLLCRPWEWNTCWQRSASRRRINTACCHSSTRVSARNFAPALGPGLRRQC